MLQGLFNWINKKHNYDAFTGNCTELCGFGLS